jgi:hypothetical protein
MYCIFLKNSQFFGAFCHNDKIINLPQKYRLFSFPMLTYPISNSICHKIFEVFWLPTFYYSRRFVMLRFVLSTFCVRHFVFDVLSFEVLSFDVLLCTINRSKIPLNVCFILNLFFSKYFANTKKFVVKAKTFRGRFLSDPDPDVWDRILNLVS